MAISAVQRKAKGTNGASVSIGAGDGWATPTTGNLLVVTANSDALVSITGTWTAGPSVIDGNGTYAWYRVSDGTESTITCTPSVSDTICITAAEYSGVAASPFDASNSSTIGGSGGGTTTAVSVTTTASGDLIVAAACLHSYSTATAPASPSWTNSFVNQLTAASGGTSPSDVTTFYAELIAGAAGAYSTAASWTNNAADRQELVIAFKAAAGGSTVNGTATLIGAGSVTATVTQGVTAAPAGTGSLVAKVTQNVVATLTGAGTLAALATQGAVTALTGAGVVSANSGSVTQGTASLTGAGTLTATVRQLAGATLTGAGALSVSAGGVVNGTASLVGAGILTINLNPCTTLRPFTGNTARPGSGTTLRPDTGITEDPC